MLISNLRFARDLDYISAHKQGLAKSMPYRQPT